MKLDGKSLERATELIETHILNHIQKKEVGEIRIETNKIIVSEGVKNEIDLQKFKWIKKQMKYYKTFSLKIQKKLKNGSI